MPTESTFLFAGLLFLAAALGYVFARFGDTDEEEEAERAARTRFLKGFRYLLDEDSDRAVDAFTGGSDLSEEGMETQLALGTLFRRRGEIDRAIRLHQDLVERQGSTVAQREAAAFALAEDYLGAGLFDRAEELFVRLRESRAHGVDALKRLLRICEVTSDWERAVDLCSELERSGAAPIPAAQLAHYYCELAEDARRRKMADRAAEMLAQAESVEPGKARALLIEADLAADRGAMGEATAALARLGTLAPGMLGDVAPRLLRLAGVPGVRDQAARALGSIAASPDGLRGVALAVMRDSRLDDPLAVEYLLAFIARQPVLGALVATGSAGQGNADTLARLRPLLQRLLKAGSRYQCGNCGYESALMQWQCPGCRSWDTVQPLKSDSLQEILG
jgi:lipopolysaccharide biosynthesis regulator YciM